MCGEVGMPKYHGRWQKKERKRLREVAWVGIHGQWQGLGRFVRAQKEKILEDWRQQKLGNQGMHR